LNRSKYRSSQLKNSTLSAPVNPAIIEKWKIQKKKSKPLNEPLISPIDRGEYESLMEPLLVANGRYEDLADLVLELVSESASFSGSLPPAFARSSSVLMRAMNCYYSNLIEGHDTHPIDIERA
jgi:hypothetical protein